MKFDFKFNNSEGVKNHLITHKLKLSKLTVRFIMDSFFYGGIFDMMYLHDSYWENPFLVDIGGHGAEIVKSTFANSKISNLIYKRSYLGLVKNPFKNFPNIHFSRKG